MDKSPLFEFANADPGFDPVAWYMSKVLVAGGMLERRRGLAGRTSAEDVVHETLIRIRDGRKFYVPRLRVDEMSLAAFDAFFFDCMDRTMGSVRAELSNQVRRGKFDDDVRLMVHRDDVSREVDPNAALNLVQAQKLIDERVAGTRAGAKMRHQAANTARFAALGYNNKEIAAETGIPLATVDKNRTRLADLMDASPTPPTDEEEK